VPFGTPFYQSPSKYAPLPYFRPLGYKRDLEDSIIDCFRNCMNADRSPTKDDPVMRDMVAYINWVRDGIVDPVVRADWTKLPAEAGPNLPVLDPGIYTDPTLPSRAVNSIGAATPTNGAALYAQRCADCHDEDGPGLGEHRVGEERPRAPALWGLRDGNGLWSSYATVLVSVESGPAPPAQADLRIDQFSATGDVRVSRNESVRFRLDVRNTGTANVPAGGYSATLVGARNGQTVYKQTSQASDPPGDGATTFTSFPAYRPTTAGDIAWTVTVLDGDADAGNDRATATTRVRQ
jgi:mono/diheme cytochrome c family protein